MVEEDNIDIIFMWEAQQVLPFYLDEIREGKNYFVQKQNWDIAADYRYQEKRIINLITEYETYNNRRRG